MSLQKKEGRNVSVDERQGLGTVINVTRDKGGEIKGACCFNDGACEFTTEAQCTEDGGVYQGDGAPCDPNPCPQCLIELVNDLGGCQGNGNGPTPDDAWDDAFSDWGDCETTGVFLPLGTIARGDFTDSGLQALAADCPQYYRLIVSPTGSVNISGVIRTYDDQDGIVNETPFSFTLTGIGDTHTLSASPFRPSNPTGMFNKTLTKIEDVEYECI